MEAKHTPGPVGASAAKRIQQEREAEALANHRERVLWLTADAPKWACGTPVDAFMRRILLQQSRAAIAKATGSTT
jgi:hypothetical protein